jgi:hypothetical protein
MYVFVCVRCWSDKMNYNSYVSPLLASRRQKYSSDTIPDSVCSGCKLHVYTLCSGCKLHVYTHTAACAVQYLSHTHTYTNLARTNCSFQPIMHVCVCVLEKCVCLCTIIILNAIMGIMILTCVRQLSSAQCSCVNHVYLYTWT